MVTADSNKEAEILALENFNKDRKNKNIKAEIVELREGLTQYE